MIHRALLDRALLVASPLASASALALAFLAAGCQRPIPDVDDGRANRPTTCLVDGDCGVGLCVDSVCDPDAVAPPDVGCTSKSECGGDLVCRTGACVEAVPGPCATSDDCPGASVCDGFSDTCVQGDGTPVFPDDDDPPPPPDPVDDPPPVDEPPPPVDEPPPPVDEPPPPVDEPPPPVDQGPPPGGVDLLGYALQNREGSTTPTTEMPEAELVPGDVVVIARDAELADFEAFWGTLPEGVYFMNAGVSTSGVPIVNGGEQFALVDPSGAVVDGVTMAGHTGMSARRISNADASLASSWAESSEYDATPGTVELPSSGVGLVISEWADATGTGNYAYEFIELYYAP